VDAIYRHLITWNNVLDGREAVEFNGIPASADGCLGGVLSMLVTSKSFCHSKPKHPHPDEIVSP